MNDAFTKGREEKRFQLYADLAQASHDSYFKMICVPVLADNGSADLTAVKEVSRAIGRGLKEGDVVLLTLASRQEQLKILYYLLYRKRVKDLD